MLAQHCYPLLYHPHGIRALSDRATNPQRERIITLATARVDDIISCNRRADGVVNMGPPPLAAASPSCMYIGAFALA